MLYIDTIFGMSKKKTSRDLKIVYLFQEINGRNCCFAQSLKYKLISF